MKVLLALCLVGLGFIVLAPACGSSENDIGGPIPAGTSGYLSKLSDKQAKALAEQYVEVQAKTITCSDGKRIMDTLSGLLDFDKTPRAPTLSDHNWHLGTNIGDFTINDDSFAVNPSGDAQEMMGMWLELANAWCARELQ